MRKKVLSIFLPAFLVLGLTFSSMMSAQAFEGDNEKIEGSYLINEEYAEDRTDVGIANRGEQMMDGMSSISKAGIGRIYVYASTTANHTVDYLSTVVYVDRFNKKENRWGQIDAWQVEQENDFYVSTTKSIKVDRGYYYRVHADHVCGMIGTPYDQEITITDGIFVD